jgi:phage terminase small subunit
MKTKKNKKKATATNELDDIRAALDAMRQNARLATAEIAKQGLMIEGSRGRNKLNPAIRVQREAMRSIAALQKQLQVLERENVQNHDQEENPFADFD